MSSDENAIPSTNTSNKMYTPCRRIGLKRKSTGTPFHTNSLKKTKESQARNCLEFNEADIITKDKCIPILNFKEDLIQKIKIKKHQIEELKSELKNSEQHSLVKIQDLTEKWLKVCQEALMSLFNHSSEYQNSNLHTVEELIKHLGIEPHLINFDSNNQEFY